eukprot:scaffold10839_cov112-Isochrysis_galbana.AAC.1
MAAWTFLPCGCRCRALGSALCQTLVAKSTVELWQLWWAALPTPSELVFRSAACHFRWLLQMCCRSADDDNGPAGGPSRPPFTITYGTSIIILCDAVPAWLRAPARPTTTA